MVKAFEVTAGSTEAEIKLAFKDWLLKNHPDKGGRMTGEDLTQAKQKYAELLGKVNSKNEEFQAPQSFDMHVAEKSNDVKEESFIEVKEEVTTSIYKFTFNFSEESSSQDRLAAVMGFAYNPGQFKGPIGKKQDLVLNGCNIGTSTYNGQENITSLFTRKVKVPTDFFGTKSPALTNGSKPTLAIADDSQQKIASPAA